MKKIILLALLLVAIAAAGCAKNSTDGMKMNDNMNGSMSDMEAHKKNMHNDSDSGFEQMCKDAGYEWMLMKPTKDGKIIQNAQTCMGCMVEGVEHICDKEKFMEITGNAKSEPIFSFTVNPEKIKANGTATFTFQFLDPEGKPLKLDVEHEKLVHVIFINNDFTIFSHIHPEDSSFTTSNMRAKGNYALNYRLEKAGKYLIGVDFASNKKDYSRIFYVNVTGNGTKQAEKDLSLQKSFNGYHINLSLPQKLAAGKESILTYQFSKENKPLTDMEPYLAAPMHIEMIKDDLTNFMHTHAMLPDEMQMMNHPMMDMGNMEILSHFGPEMIVRAAFPEKGFYHIFGEFKHDGKVIVTHFIVEVE